jgi:hypothetical protein
MPLVDTGALSSRSVSFTDPPDLGATSSKSAGSTVPTSSSGKHGEQVMAMLASLLT